MCPMLQTALIERSYEAFRLISSLLFASRASLTRSRLLQQLVACLASTLLALLSPPIESSVDPHPPTRALASSPLRFACCCCSLSIPPLACPPPPVVACCAISSASRRMRHRASLQRRMQPTYSCGKPSSLGQQHTQHSTAGERAMHRES